MALQKIFCPNCGNETLIDNEKAFCFCLQCGNKIENIKKESVGEQDIVSKKLDEVSFYYGLSREKREYEKYNENPVYYIKAQDILIDLSEEYPNDYRIWWELCKPIDFENPMAGNEVCDSYFINENFFDKALDHADINKKKELIEAHDNYKEKKKSLKKIEADKKKFEDEVKEIEELIRNNNKKQEAVPSNNQELWMALERKEYTQIDNSYFRIPSDNNQQIIGVFKVVANVMYLSAFRIEGDKVYREQSLSIKFDGNGCGIKFDNDPIRIRGLDFPHNGLRVEYNENGGLKINNMDLIVDIGYVGKIMSQAKKPLLSFEKIFD